MNPDFLSPDHLRARFAEQLQSLYRQEVPAYARLHDLVLRVNEAVLRDQGDPRSADAAKLRALSAQRHGAIRVGSPAELAGLGRLFALLGMYPVDFYDLIPAGLPVMSTAFRPVTKEAMAVSPFRMFCSMLRPELISDPAARDLAEATLASRAILSKPLLALMSVAEERGGVPAADADEFLRHALDVFRWHGRARVSRSVYEALLGEHRLVADIAAFPGPHINHLTPSTLDIDRAQAAMQAEGFNAKAVVEGPPRRACPILLRQTACTAQPEAVRFADAGETGAHTARFGEIEQRGIALTEEGRRLYDACLENARVGAETMAYDQSLEAAFADFPDDPVSLVESDLAYFRFTRGPDGAADAHDLTEPAGRAAALRSGVLQAEPILYEDFLPVSAAGIFRSNLGDAATQNYISASSQDAFEAALGRPVLSSQVLYAEAQSESLAAL